jgi:hypothetical protein
MILQESFQMPQKQIMPEGDAVILGRLHDSDEADKTGVGRTND